MRPPTPAVAYLRTSSATNVGENKDSETRQRLAIDAHARRASLAVVETFYDAAVSGADPIDQRPGFTALLAWATERGVTTILVENASRFARDLIVQEIGHGLLARQGFTLIAADDPDAFTADTPTARMVRQILGAVSEFEKGSLVAKLKGARERKRAAQGRCEGRRGLKDTHPELIRLARRLARQSPKTGHRRSLREIATELARLGHVNSRGHVYSTAQIARMLAG